MKKLLSSVFILLISISTLPYAMAQDENSHPLTIFESTENLQKLDSYTMNQVVGGSLQFNTDSKDVDGVMGSFRFNIITDVENLKPYEINTDSDISGYFSISLKGNDKPFENMVVNLRAQIITIYKDGFYIRFNDLNFLTKGIPNKDIESFNEFRGELNRQFSEVKGQWIYFPEDYYKGGFDNGMPTELSTLDKETIKENAKNKGLKATYRQIITDLINSLAKNNDITDDQEQTFKKISDRFFNTKFFSEWTVKTGKNKGYVSFFLDKSKILNFFQSVSKDLNEDLTENDIAEIKSALGKFSIRGLYNIDPVNRIFDKFFIKLELFGFEGLSKTHIKYSSEIKDLNKDLSIKEPDDFTPVDQMNLPLLPQSTTDSESVPTGSTTDNSGL